MLLFCEAREVQSSDVEQNMGLPDVEFCVDGKTLWVYGREKFYDVIIFCEQHSTLVRKCVLRVPREKMHAILMQCAKSILKDPK